MTRYINVEGERCKVIEALGYYPDIHTRVTLVEHNGAERMAVRLGIKDWHFWRPTDRVKPLFEALWSQRHIPHGQRRAM
jgi:hypothetical protein